MNRTFHILDDLYGWLQCFRSVFLIVSSVPGTGQSSVGINRKHNCDCFVSCLCNRHFRLECFVWNVISSGFGGVIIAGNIIHIAGHGDGLYDRHRDWLIGGICNRNDPLLFFFFMGDRKHDVADIRKFFEHIIHASILLL